MDEKDHVIQAYREMVAELTNKLINMRAAIGVELEKQKTELDKQKTELDKQKLNGDTERLSAT
jgi:uncharacterized membrane-anchored protein YhcB (DUF1043 family)